MPSVTFKGTTIITTVTGCWKPLQRGMFDRVIEFENAVRGFGDIGKDLHMTGAIHTLEITFLNVASGTVNTIHNALDSLYNPSSGRITSGQLVVQDMHSSAVHTLNHCVMLTPEPGQPELRVKGITPTDADGDGTSYWDIPYTLKFRQTRR